MFGDTLDGYRERNGHAVYGEHDIEYKFNSFGYRCSEFEMRAEIRVLVIGCSYVIGTGLAQPDIFHEIFASRLRKALSKSIVLWNLGMCAASNDYISRLLLLAVPRLNPDIVLVNFTYLGRREYFSPENQRLNYHAKCAVPKDERTRDTLSHFKALTSPNDDVVRFYKNYKITQLILGNHFWLFSHISSDDFLSVRSLLDASRNVGRLSFEDRARDDGHPGVESHKALANHYWEKFVELGGLQRFSRP